MPPRVSCLGPMLRLACSGGGGGGPVPFLPTWLGAARSPCVGRGRGDPSSTPPRALVRAGFAPCGGGTRVPGGAHLLPGCGASGVGRIPTPDHSSFRACGRGPLPTGCGCGGYRRGDPSSTPPRALLRAGFARCEGGMRVPRGGASCLGIGDWALSHPRPPVLWGVWPGPTTHWPWVRGVRTWGPVTGPRRALLRAGFARC